MRLCIVSPRFHPIIGGAEIYLKNIAQYCSSLINTIVITSDLKNLPLNLFEQYLFIKEKYDLIPNNVEIIRAHTLRNLFLKTTFYFKQFINKKLELYLDKYLNPQFYHNKYNNNFIQMRSNTILEKLFYQRFLENPNFSQIYFILKKVHYAQKIGLIHSCPIYLTSNIYAFHFSRKYHIPFICTPLFHINPYANYILYPSYQYILKNSDAIIACTNLEKKYYQKFDIKKEKIHIIPPGIDPNDYKNFNVEKFKEKYNIPVDAIILLFIGRRVYEKGIFHSIFSLKYLIKKFKNIKLIIAGPTTKEYNFFFNKVPSKIKSHIIDLGIVDQKTKTNAFASCDIFLLPSVADAFGIVNLEAWLFKKPVIGALEGNIAGLIDNDINGLLVPFKNIKLFSAKIEFLLNNEEKCKELGNNGYKKLLNNYTLEKTNKMMLNLYKKYV